MKTSDEELEELKTLFLKLDTSKDGLLSIDEVTAGLDHIREKLKSSKIDYTEIMATMDKDGNGVIDYTEFITAAINKVAVLN